MYVIVGHRQVVAVEGLHFNKSLVWRKAGSGRCRSRVGADLSSTGSSIKFRMASANGQCHTKATLQMCEPFRRPALGGRNH